MLPIKCNRSGTKCFFSGAVIASKIFMKTNIKLNSMGLVVFSLLLTLPNAKSFAFSYTPPTDPLAHCVSAADSCDFYQCAEDVLGCGDSGYLIDVGLKYCKPTKIDIRIKDKDEQSSLLSFKSRVRQCLQENVKSIVRESSEDLTCPSLKDKALRSHVPCFVDNGFCELSTFDTLAIYDRPLDFVLLVGVTGMIKMWHELSHACEQRGLSHVDTANSGILLQDGH